MSDKTDCKIALYIDAENVNCENGNKIIEFLEGKGKVVIREIVADWTKISAKKDDKLNADSDKVDINLRGWRKVAADCSMTAIQQFTYVRGKNSSDIALAVSAMKALYEKPFIDMFCIVSNDSDYTRLAQELREQNKEVVGMGDKQKIVPEFVNAYSEFVYLWEPIEKNAPEKPASKPSAAKKPTKPKPAAVEPPVGREQLDALISLIRIRIDDFGRALYSVIGGDIRKKYPDFIPSNYGCKTFRQLMDKLLPFMPMFKMDETDDDRCLVSAEKKQKGKN